MVKVFLSFSILLLASSFATAHNENLPGPHGGHIQMPANFHTEVVPDSDKSYHIYLLDLQFQNPTVKNSNVKAYTINGSKHKTGLKCAVMGEDHFHCISPKPINKGFLIIKAMREGTKASMEAKYILPLKAFTTKSENLPAPMEDHSKH